MGVVIRRGPSKSVATLLWKSKTDQFQLGQWFKGRIYERRSDLFARRQALSLLCDEWEIAHRNGRLMDSDFARSVPQGAADGRLEAGRLTTRGVVGEIRLFDFNEMTFEPIEAPY